MEDDGASIRPRQFPQTSECLRVNVGPTAFQGLDDVGLGHLHLGEKMIVLADGSNGRLARVANLAELGHFGETGERTDVI